MSQLHGPLCLLADASSYVVSVSYTAHVTALREVMMKLLQLLMEHYQVAELQQLLLNPQHHHFHSFQLHLQPAVTPPVYVHTPNGTAFALDLLKRGALV